MNKQELETISFIINELNTRKIEYTTDVSDTGVESDNLWFDIIIRFKYNNEDQKIEFSSCKDIENINISSLIFSGSNRGKEVSRLRFCEFLNTLEDLLKSIENSKTTIRILNKYCLDKNSSKSIYEY